MLSLLLGWTLLGALAWAVASPWLSRLDPTGPDDRLLWACWLGLLALGNGLLSASLFWALSPWVCAAVGLAACATRLAFRGDAPRPALRLPAPATWLLLMGCAHYASQLVLWGDTGLYHLQAMRWLQQAGTVPGLALLQDQLAYSSSWLALASAFDVGWLEGRSSGLLGGLALALGLSQWAFAAARATRQPARGEDVFLAVGLSLVLAYALRKGMPVSPSPDLPVALLCVLVGWALLYRPAGLLALALAAGAVSIKLAAAPLLAIASLQAVHARRRAGRLAAVVALCLAGLLPRALAARIESGCPLYPSPLLCVEGPSSVGAAHAGTISSLVRDWARWRGAPSAGAGPLEWLGPWSSAEPGFVAWLGLFALAAIWVLWRHRSVARGWVLALAASGVALVLSSAPTLRFGVGYLALAPALAASLFFEGRRARRAVSGGWLVAASCAGLVALAQVGPSNFHRRAREALARGELHSEWGRVSLLRPPPVLPVRPTFAPTDLRVLSVAPQTLARAQAVDFEAWAPIGSDLCWDAPLPCTPLPLQGVRLREPVRGFLGGFAR